MHIPMPESPPPRMIQFSLRDLAEQVEAFWRRFPDARADESGSAFGPGVEAGVLTLPAAASRARPGERLRGLQLQIRRGIIAFVLLGMLAAEW